jgi:hypothetical protein
VSCELPCGAVVATNPLNILHGLLCRAIFRELRGIRVSDEKPLEFHSSERAGNGAGRRSKNWRNRLVKRSAKLNNEERTQ